MEELIYKYRNLPIKIRVIIAFILGLTPGVMAYVTLTDEIAIKKSSVTALLDVEQKKNDKMRKEIEKIPEIQTLITENEGRIQKANKLLPATVEIDQVLHDVSVAAKKNYVAMLSFSPKKKRFPQKGLDYAEKSFEMDFSGKFQNIMTFFDEVVHFERIHHLRNMRFRRSGESVQAKVEIILYTGEEYASSK